MSTHVQRTSNQSGFALILALLALLLLTVLGLTLATTTTTEMQIASNYRYGRQALYNAEAGMQTARYILAQQQMLGNVGLNLPPIRQNAPTSLAPWADGSATTPAQVTVADTSTGAPGDYYPLVFTGGVPPSATCDTRGGVGYGRVLLDTTNNPVRNKAVWADQVVQGGFTVFIRRPLATLPAGTFQDEPLNDLVVVTVLGTAPYADKMGDVQNQAVRVVEETLHLTQANSKPCGSGAYQTGRDQLGTNYDPCGSLPGSRPEDIRWQ